MNTSIVIVPFTLFGMSLLLGISSFTLIGLVLFGSFPPFTLVEIVLLDSFPSFTFFGMVLFSSVHLFTLLGMVLFALYLPFTHWKMGLTDSVDLSAAVGRAIGWPKVCISQRHRVQLGVVKVNNCIRRAIAAANLK
jgi:hypothetical protein